MCRSSVAAVLVLLAACHGQSGTSGTQPAILAGDPASPAAQALPDAHPAPAGAQDIQGQILLSRLTVVLRRDATVSQVNAALALAGATSIAFSRKGSPFITLAVPRQASPADLAGLAGKLRGQPGILAAVPGRTPSAQQLPSDGVHAPVDADTLGQLLVARFPAAWNAHARAEKECASRKVTVLIPDYYFGDTPATFLDQVPGELDNFATLPLAPLDATTEQLHGFEVSAALAGRFDEILPTGANPFPACLRLVPVDLSAFDAFQAVAAIREAIEREEGKTVVNLSVGFRTALCGPGLDAPCAAADVNATIAPALLQEMVVRVSAAILWGQFGLQPGVVEDTLLSVCAGNDHAPSDREGALGTLYPGLHDARLASPFAFAAQLGALESILSDASLWSDPADPSLPSLVLDAQTISDLRDQVAALVPAQISGANLALVGSTTSSEVAEDLQQSAFSNDHVDLNAVGESVVSLGGHLVSGTSFSAPQVAGLASYLWLLDDGLRGRPVAETLQLIRGASRNTANVAGLVDAYAAVLALDALDQTRDLRLALVDANGDGNFDHLDLQLFAQAYDLANPNRATIPDHRDYGRFDLNGDGFTGGIVTQPFDLDLSPAATVTETIEGYPIDMSKAALSDVQILCFYAYSDLYAASPVNHDEAIAERSTFLGPANCVGAQISGTIGAFTSGSAPLTVTVQISGGGQLRAAPDLLVSLNGTCATINPAQATTDASGRIAATVTPGAGCSSFSIDATARGAASSPVLAQKTITGTPAVAQVQLIDRDIESFLIIAGAFRRQGDTQVTQNFVYETDFTDPLFFNGYSRFEGPAFVTLSPHDSQSGGYSFPGASGSYSATSAISETMHLDPNGDNFTGAHLVFDSICSLTLARPQDVGEGCGSNPAPAACSQMEAASESSFSVDFKVLSGSVQLSLTGSLHLRKDFLGRNDGDSSSAVVRLSQSGVGAIFGQDIIFGRNLPGSPGDEADLTVNHQLTLGPGTYDLELDLDATCSLGTGTTFHPTMTLDLAIAP